jgi:isocitrate dehydrogenase
LRITEATKFTNPEIRKGKNAIAGNVLRDHLTDMYPILELGTSAKMLSIVPLIAGGGLFETGAGGSAPKHLDQFLETGHLRWDSLGEFLALAESFRMINQKNPNANLATVTEALDKANQAYLDNNKAPSRKVGEPDNKASRFFVAQYWANALAESDNAELSAKFAPVAKAFTENESKIIEELLATEGSAKDIGGYYHPNDELAEKAMRPSATLNEIINNI